MFFLFVVFFYQSDSGADLFSVVASRRHFLPIKTRHSSLKSPFFPRLGCVFLCPWF